MNQDLKQRLEKTFKPLGIIAWSGCCRLGCTGSYDEDDDTFQLRKCGIVFFKLFLSGMNYVSRPKSCYVQYTDWNYLKNNWDAEKALIRKWCRIVGLRSGEYTVDFPKDEKAAIGIHFNQPLTLDPPVSLGSLVQKTSTGGGLSLDTFEVLVDLLATEIQRSQLEADLKELKAENEALVKALTSTRLKLNQTNFQKTENQTSSQTVVNQWRQCQLDQTNLQKRLDENQAQVQRLEQELDQCKNSQPASLPRSTVATTNRQLKLQARRRDIEERHARERARQERKARLDQMMADEAVKREERQRKREERRAELARLVQNV